MTATQPLALSESPDLYGAFPRLSDEQIAALETVRERRSVKPGDVLFREGDGNCDFFVILEGKVAVVEEPGAGERGIGVHGPRRFLGELSLLTGQAVFVSAVVREPGEVLVVPQERAPATPPPSPSAAGAVQSRPASSAASPTASAATDGSRTTAPPPAAAGRRRAPRCCRYPAPLRSAAPDVPPEHHIQPNHQREDSHLPEPPPPEVLEQLGIETRCTCESRPEPERPRGTAVQQRDPAPQPQSVQHATQVKGNPIRDIATAPCPAT